MLRNVSLILIKPDIYDQCNHWQYFLIKIQFFSSRCIFAGIAATFFEQFWRMRVNIGDLREKHSF